MSAEIELDFVTSSLIKISSKYTKLFSFNPGSWATKFLRCVGPRARTVYDELKVATNETNPPKVDGWTLTTITLKSHENATNRARSLKGGAIGSSPRWPQTPQSPENHQPQKIASRMNKPSRCLYHCLSHSFWNSITITMMERRAKFYSFVQGSKVDLVRCLLNGLPRASQIRKYGARDDVTLYWKESTMLNCIYGRFLIRRLSWSFSSRLTSCGLSMINTCKRFFLIPINLLRQLKESNHSKNRKKKTWIWSMIITTANLNLIYALSSQSLDFLDFQNLCRDPNLL